jgi:hypothetical protein
MSNISVNPSATRQNNLPEIGDSIAKGLGLSGKAAEVVNQALSLLGETGVKVQNAGVRTDSAGTPTGASGVPVLDNPDDVKAMEANLERLVAFLQLDNDERQTQMAQDRIDTLKSSLKSEHEGRAKKIQKSLDDMDKAAASQKRNKIFGWLMTALAVVAAVVACVATGGLATGAVVAAGLALTCQILNETGVMEKLTDKLAKGLESLGLSKEAAQIVAQVAVTVAIVAASIAAGNLGSISGSVSAGVKAVTDVLRPAIAIATGVMGGVSIISSGVGAHDGYKAGMSQADVKETEKFIELIRRKLEESEEELQQILDAIQALMGQLADLLSSASDTGEEIAQQIGQMA